MPLLTPEYQGPRNTARADAIIDFIERLPIVDGPAVGQRIKLDPFQIHWIRSIYEPGDRDNGLRVVKTAILSIARKNSKSYLVAGLLLCHLVGSECVPNGQVYSCATDREQASVIFRMIKQMIEKTPALARVLKVVQTTKTIFVTRSDLKSAGSVYRALSADAGTKHGLGADFFVYDEYGEARNKDLWDVMADSQGARLDPLAVVISTQAAEPDHPLSIMIDDALSGADETVVCRLHTATEGCDLLDESAWLEANPCLASWKKREPIAKKAAEAKRVPTSEANFRRRYLNQRVNDLATLVPRAEWEAAEKRHDGLQAGDAIYLGLDMSQTTDLTALVAVSVEDHSRVASWFWKPSALIADHAKRDSAPYDVWVKQGHMIAAPGKIIDPEAVARHVVMLASIYDIKALAYDRYGINALLKEFDKLDFDAQEGEGDGLRLEPWGQGFSSMAPAVTAFETALLTEDLSHDGNPVLTRCVMNAVVRMDPAGNRKLDKDKSTGRIDGAVSLAMAMGLKARDRPANEPKQWDAWSDPNFAL